MSLELILTTTCGSAGPQAIPCPSGCKPSTQCVNAACTHDDGGNTNCNYTLKTDCTNPSYPFGGTCQGAFPLDEATITLVLCVENVSVSSSHEGFGLLSILGGLTQARSPTLIVLRAGVCRIRALPTPAPTPSRTSVG
jgi:hypothetical protein